MKVLVNYANELYRKQQQLNTKTGYQIGHFDKVFEYSPEDIDKQFFEKNNDIFSEKQGAGLWLWKPWAICDALGKIDNGDYLFYCDSAAYFTNSVDPLIRRMENEGVDIMPFELPLTDLQFTSKDCIQGMDCLDYKYLLTAQRTGSYLLLKKSDYSVRIIGEYLRLCQNKLLLQGGELGENCIAHRLDQSIWSLLTKKEGIKAFRDPSQYAFDYITYLKWVTSKGKTAIAAFDEEMLNNDAPVIVELYRKTQIWKPFVKLHIKIYRAKKEMMLALKYLFSR